MCVDISKALLPFFFLHFFVAEISVSHQSL